MSRWLFHSVVLLLSWTLIVPVVAGAEGPAANAMRPVGSKNRAAWMAQGTYGVMTHYLIEPKGSTPEERTADLNRTVDRFDLDHFIRQFQETRADWLIFTLGQCTGYLCSPNAYLDAKAPGRTPRRDLALEIARRLKPLGKRLILYIPSEQAADPAIQQALDYTSDGHADRYFEFLRQYSVKFGTLHHGWWFDSCSPHPDEYWKRYLAAVRTGNPDAAVAFSGTPTRSCSSSSAASRRSGERSRSTYRSTWRAAISPKTATANSYGSRKLSVRSEELANTCQAHERATIQTPTHLSGGDSDPRADRACRELACSVRRDAGNPAATDAVRGRMER